MADLLLQASAMGPRHVSQSRRPPSRRKSSSLAPPPCTGAARPTCGAPSLLGTVSDKLRDAAGFWRSPRVPVAEERKRTRSLSEKKSLLYSRMKTAGSLEQWQAAARELDVLEGNEGWKNDSSPSSEPYNPALIEQRLRALDDARARCDIPAMMHEIRTALSRNLGGMGNVQLYKHSHLGTKTLIENYVDSTVRTIYAVIEQSASDAGVSYKDLLEGMLLARQSFGRSALLLSGGGTFGMAHTGVLQTLHEAQLLPRIVSGASAGSIVCAVFCTRTDEEIPELVKSFPYGDLAVFDPTERPDSVFDHLRRLFTEGSWSDIKHLCRVMRDMMGDMTFQEAYNRTRRILNICVSTEAMYELPRLLNYVTAPNVMIWSAVAASCSVPFVFNGSSLLVKDPATGEHRPWNPTPQRWIDGSVENDLPMTRLAEMFNVNHFIVSQVNPHVVPFLARDDYLPPEARASAIKAVQAGGVDWLQTLTSLARDEALHRLNFLAEVGFFPNVMTKVRSVLSQRYSGDINIIPEMTMDNLPAILRNPTADFMIRCCLVGQRATWPRLSRIRDSCAVELALDRAVHRLRTRVVFSESRSELRYLANVPSSSSGHHLRPQAQALGGLTSRPSQMGLSMTGPGGYHYRQRRQSVSSLLILQSSRMMLGGDDDYDDDGDADADEDRGDSFDDYDDDDEDSDDDVGEEEEEEHLEMASRVRSAPSSQSRSAGKGNGRKPPLQRASKSSTHVLQYRRGSFMRDAEVEEPVRGFLVQAELEFCAGSSSSPPPPPPLREDTTLTDAEAPLMSDTESDHGLLLFPVEAGRKEEEEEEEEGHCSLGAPLRTGAALVPAGHVPGHLLGKVQPLARQSQ